MAERKTVADYPELVAQWHPTRNGELKPDDCAHKSNKKVWWKCPIADDHEWEARISSRTAGGNGCSCCRGLTVVPSNCLATTHPDIAARWHPTKNGTLTPNDVTAGSHKIVWWKCSVADDHEWQSRTNTIVSMQIKCPCCNGQWVVLSNCLATTHPEIAAQWHRTKNGTLTPNDVTAGSNKKVWWRCSVADDHEWQAFVNSRKRGDGCPCCCGDIVVPSNCLATVHPEIAAQWHPTKNGTLTPKDVAGGNTKYWWKCSVADDHEWQARISRRIIGEGCSCCRGFTVVPSNCLATTHPNIAAQWHPTKNGTLTPKDVTAGSHIKAWWKCIKNHKWEVSPNQRTSKIGSGCPVCKERRGEKSIRDHLVQRNAKFKSQFRFKKSRITKYYDFAIRDVKFTGTVEYQGEQHYIPTNFGSNKINAKERGFIDNIKRDHLKLSFCLKHHIPLLLIPFWDIDNIPSILDDVLSGKEPSFSEPPEIVKKYGLMRQKIRDKLGITEPEVLCGLIKENKLCQKLQ